MIDMLWVMTAHHGAVGPRWARYKSSGAARPPGGHQRVDDDQPSVTSTKLILEISNCDLIDARHHLVEASFRGQLGFAATG